LTDLKVKVGKVTFKNPVLVASGTFGYGEEYSELFDLNQLGGIVTKSITLNPREGNPPPRTCETPSGMLNSIGLANVGVESFVKEKLQFFRKFKTKVIVNVAGSTRDEYLKVVEKLNRAKGIDMLEMNISCPNVKEGGMAFGSDPESAYRCVKSIRFATDYPLLTKLTPNVKDIVEIAQAVEEAGTDCISLINTLVGMAVDSKTKKPLLKTVTGGLSGPAIKPVALAMVWKVSQKVEIPVVGIGGITNAQDALEFLLAGASLIQVGTANFVDPRTSIKIIQGLEKYCYENNIKNLKEIIGKLETKEG